MTLKALFRWKELVERVDLRLIWCENKKNNRGRKIRVAAIMFFRKKKTKEYDKENKRPVLRCSICTGEQVAGFKDINSGAFEEEMMISSPKDLEEFKEMYGIEGELEKIY